MTVEAYNIEILSNAIKYGSTWIPLDQISYLEKTEKKEDFLISFIKSLAIIIIGALAFHEGLNFLLKFAPYSNVDLNKLLRTTENFMESSKYETEKVVLIYSAGLYLFYHFWKIRRVLRILSTSGDGIVIFNEEFMLFDFFSTKTKGDEVFEKILHAKESYMRTIALLPGELLIANEKLQKVLDKKEELERTKMSKSLPDTA